MEEEGGGSRQEGGYPLRPRNGEGDLRGRGARGRHPGQDPGPGAADRPRGRRRRPAAQAGRIGRGPRSPSSGGIRRGAESARRGPGPRREEEDRHRRRRCGRLPGRHPRGPHGRRGDADREGHPRGHVPQLGLHPYQVPAAVRRRRPDHEGVRDVRREVQGLRGGLRRRHGPQERGRRAAHARRGRPAEGQESEGYPGNGRLRGREDPADPGNGRGGPGATPS